MHHIHQTASDLNCKPHGLEEKQRIFQSMRLMRNLIIYLILFLASLSVGAIPSAHTENLPSVAVINMGGTITSIAPSPLAYFDYSGHGNYSSEEIFGRIPEVFDIANIVFINSQEMIAQTNLPEASATVMSALDDPDIVGAVVHTGTWAMEEVAYFLHLTVNSDKPVVVTGSQRPVDLYSSDAHKNIYDSVRLASSSDAQGMGVMVLFAEEIFSAREVTKTVIYRPEAFTSREFGPLGSVDADRIVFYRKPVRRHTYDTEFDVSAYSRLGELPRVEIIYGYRGADDHLIRAAVEGGATGIVIAAMGDGWLPDIEEALKEAVENGIAVVRSSRIGENRVMPWARYEGIFIAGDNLLPQKARILLMLGLMQTSDVSELQRMFDEY